MENYWVWCGSPVQDDRGVYHLFASRWPKRFTFNPHWLTHSEIVRAEAERPEGPYVFREVVLPARGPDFWDGRMTHNPAVCRRGSEFLLFYTGSTYPGPEITPEDRVTADDLGIPSETPNLDQRVLAAHANQRIGVAVASDPRGPWKRLDAPVIEPRQGEWDGLMTTNPAPCVLPDGSIRVIYKSVGFRGDLMRLGMVRADVPEGPYLRVQDTPLFNFDDTGEDVEDPYLWYADGFFHVIMKDMEGGIGGVPRDGIYWTSVDGVTWDRTNVRPAYSRRLLWEDGVVREQPFLERPSLLFQDGKPTHLFAATASGGDHVSQIADTWNMVLKMTPEFNEK